MMQKTALVKFSLAMKAFFHIEQIGAKINSIKKF